MDRLRIGILGAARIAPAALVRPARQVAAVEVAGIAAREPARAEHFARKHGIAKAHRSYADLIADPGIDAIYNPLPNGLHAHWSLQAIAAGKHVLCEKPFTANADEAQAIAEAAAAAGVVVMEAFHYRYHPLAERMRSIAHSGELGAIRSVRTGMCFPLPKFSDIRYDFALAGGAMMDAGCYALHCLRLLGPGAPELVSATALRKTADVDRAMRAEFTFTNGATGRLDCSLWSREVLNISAEVAGERGRLRVFNYVAPHIFHRLSLTIAGRTRHERVQGEPTYTAQLRQFVAAVLQGAPILTPADDAVVTMGLIDAIYTAAGLPRRGANPEERRSEGER